MQADLEGLGLGDLWELRDRVTAELETRPRPWDEWVADPAAFRAEIATWPTALIEQEHRAAWRSGPQAVRDVLGAALNQRINTGG